MKTVISVLACVCVAACSTPGYRALNPSCIEDKGLAKYQRDGHQDTTYIVAVLAGRSPREAALLSFYNQAADDLAMRFSAPNVAVWGSVPGAWGYRHRINAVLHSLHGGDVGAVQERRDHLAGLIAASDPDSVDHAWQTGLLIHAFGDSFAHTRDDGSAYGGLYGHLFDGHAPDIVANRPNLYLDYVRALYAALETSEANTDGFAAFTGLVAAVGEGADVDAYRQAIFSGREISTPAPDLRCDTLAGRLNMREVSAFLREIDPG